MIASTADLLRLLAVPVFAGAAWRDVRTRRVPNRTWIPLAVLGAALFVWEGWSAVGTGGYDRHLFAIQATVSLGIVVPVAYLFWRIGGFGGADAKALMVLALLFPSYPVYYLSWGALPLSSTPIGVFSLTILSNTVIVGICYPVALAAKNALDRRVSPIMFVARPVRWDELDRTHGRLLETPDGVTRRGLDLDALRMYLDWRRASIEDVRDRPDELRNPASLPETPGSPGDGAVADGGTAVNRKRNREVEPDYDDPWGAAAFLADVDGSAYGTTPDQLRDGLEVVATRDRIWVSPGIPFLVPMFVGLLVGLVYGDLLYAVMVAVGLA